MLYDIKAKLDEIKNRKDNYESYVGKKCRVVYDKHLCDDFPNDAKHVDRIVTVLDSDNQMPPIYYCMFDDDNEHWAFFEAMLQPID